MKTISTFSAHNNGAQSKLNVHFSDGSQFTRTIEAREAIELSKTKSREYLAELMKKYSEPQPKPEMQRLDIGERNKGGF